MRSFEISVDEKYFNFLWRSICAREDELEAVVSQEPEESDAAVMAANDLVYLRLCKKELERKARDHKFSDGAFSTDDGFIDLADM